MQIVPVMPGENPRQTCPAVHRMPHGAPSTALPRQDENKAAPCRRFTNGRSNEQGGLPSINHRDCGEPGLTDARPVCPASRVGTEEMVAGNRLLPAHVQASHAAIRLDNGDMGERALSAS